MLLNIPEDVLAFEAAQSVSYNMEPRIIQTAVAGGELDEKTKEHLKNLKELIKKYPMEDKDPFWFCQLGGCEGVSKTCIKDCPYGIESKCPPFTKEPVKEYIEQCTNCNKSCTKRDSIINGIR